MSEIIYLKKTQKVRVSHRCYLWINKVESNEKYEKHI
jgi:hypothetical protein